MTFSYFPFKLNGGTPLMKTTWHGPAHSPLCSAPPAYTHATADGDYRQNVCRGQRSTLKAPHQAVFSSLFLFAPLRGGGWVCGGRSYAWGLGTKGGMHAGFLNATKKLTRLAGRGLSCWFSSSLHPGNTHTPRLSMAKFLAELLGCTLPDKGTPPVFEVRHGSVLSGQCCGVSESLCS